WCVVLISISFIVFVYLIWIFKTSSIECPDKKTVCPDGTTCCQMTNGSFGCCPMPDVSVALEHEGT
uniref:Granulins domain-containing protein n=1 Tax=Poecilia mexicana TaxID=48701 RepID=A0A3B3Z323_9TELE